MEYMSEEQKQRIRMNNDYIDMSEQMTQRNNERINNIRDAIKEIKNTIAPSPWKLAGDLIRTVTDTDPTTIITKDGIGSMAKSTMRSHAFKNIGLAITGSKPIEQKQNLSDVQPVLQNVEAHRAIYTLEQGGKLSDAEKSALNAYISDNYRMIPETAINILNAAIQDKVLTDAEKKIISEWHADDIQRPAEPSNTSKIKTVCFIIGGMLILKFFISSLRR